MILAAWGSTCECCECPEPALAAARGSPDEPPPADALLEMGLAGLGFSSVEEFNAAIAVRNEAERIDLLNFLFMLLISAY